MAEEAAGILLAAGGDVNTTNEGDYTALHCAAFSGLSEVVELLVTHGADIDARDWRGRTAFRLAEGAKQSFHYQAWPEVAALLEALGADTSLGIPGTRPGAPARAGGSSPGGRRRRAASTPYMRQAP